MLLLCPKFWQLLDYCFVFNKSKQVYKKKSNLLMEIFKCKYCGNSIYFETTSFM